MGKRKTKGRILPPRSVAPFVGSLVFLFCVNVALAAKTDKVKLINGDVITCEIESLKRGILRVSTDSMGTLDIEWDEVVAVTSEQDLLVETVDGTRYFGALVISDDPAMIKVQVADEDDADAELHELAKSEVVLITPIEEKFIDKLEADLSLGYSFTKSSDVGQFTFSADVRYRTEKYRLRLNAKLITTEQEEAKTTRTSDAVVDYRYFLQNRWYALALGGLQKNEELGIELRTFAGGGGGRNLIQTNRSQLSLSGAALAVHENFTESSDTLDSVEASFGLEYEYFILNEPKRDVRVQFTLIPSLTESGRVRTEFDTRFKLELAKDFFWELRFFASTDSEPPSEAFSDSDYGIITSFGYSL